MAKQVRGFGTGAEFYDADGEVDEDRVREFVKALLGRTTIDPDEPLDRLVPIDEDAQAQRFAARAEGWKATMAAARKYVADPDAHRSSPAQKAQIRDRAYGRAIARQIGQRSADEGVSSASAQRARGQR